MTVKFKKPYADRKRVQIDFRDSEGNYVQGRTEQCHKQECDIDYILRRYDKTGLITHVNQSVAQYGDYTEVNEYQQSLNLVIKAQASFDQLPAKIRQKFNHDPGQFFEFATNPDNHDEMVSLGLAQPKPSHEGADEGVGTVAPLDVTVPTDTITQ